MRRRQKSKMREIQVTDPMAEDHTMCFPETNFQISLSFWERSHIMRLGKPTAEFMKETDDVHMLTPSRWNPHCDAYAMNEQAMLD